MNSKTNSIHHIHVSLYNLHFPMRDHIFFNMFPGLLRIALFLTSECINPLRKILKFYTKCSSSQVQYSN